VLLPLATLLPKINGWDLYSTFFFFYIIVRSRHILVSQYLNIHITIFHSLVTTLNSVSLAKNVNALIFRTHQGRIGRSDWSIHGLLKRLVPCKKQEHYLVPSTYWYLVSEGIKYLCAAQQPPVGVPQERQREEAPGLLFYHTYFNKLKMIYYLMHLKYNT